jgi:2-C-methyl-D-erythritol 4-phosphate cytidylyltransferase
MIKKGRAFSGQPYPSGFAPKTVAVIPAAGAGVRMGIDQPKQYLELDGRPLLSVTLERFQRCPSVAAVILVAPPEDLDYCRKTVVEPLSINKNVQIVAGGKRRQDSVLKGIEASRGDYELVLIHDGVRPLVTTSFIEDVISAARKERAVVAALPSKETVKEIGEDLLVIRTYNRRFVWLVQTPQVFQYEDILYAHRKALEEGWDDVTDDASLLEKIGIPVRVLEGREDNIKVTTPHDLDMARYLLERQS